MTRETGNLLTNAQLDQLAAYEETGQLYFPLHRAAAYGDFQGLMRALAEDAHPNSPCRTTISDILHRASKRVDSAPFLDLFGGQEALESKLLEEALNPQHGNEKELTALHWAATPEIAEVLIQAGSDLNATDDRGITPLHWLTQLGYVNSVKYLIEQGADTNQTDQYGENALHKAVTVDSRLLIELLVEAGTDLESQTAYSHSTPLHRAIRHASLNTIEQLLQLGANPNARRIRADETALIQAIRQNRPDVVEIVSLLLCQGADLDAADSNDKAAENWAESINNRVLLSYLQTYQQRIKKH